MCSLPLLAFSLMSHLHPWIQSSSGAAFPQGSWERHWATFPTFGPCLGTLKGTDTHISSHPFLLSLALLSRSCVFYFWNIISHTWAEWHAWGYFCFSCPYNELVNRCLQALVRITFGQVFHRVSYMGPISKVIRLWFLSLQSQKARLGTCTTSITAHMGNECRCYHQLCLFCPKFQY